MSQNSISDQFENLVSTLSIVTVIAIVALIGELMKNPNLTMPVRARVSAPVQSSFYTLPSDPNERHELDIRFQQAVALLHAKQYEYAVTALDRVMQLAPQMPEAYVNMGFAYLGLKDFETARKLFDKATDLRPEQTNAYWGLAEALEGTKDYEGALGAMRSYIHLSKPNDPYLPKARSALWEWEARLGRIPGVNPKPQENNASNEKMLRPGLRHNHSSPKK